MVHVVARSHCRDDLFARKILRHKLLIAASEETLHAAADHGLGNAPPRARELRELLNESARNDDLSQMLGGASQNCEKNSHEM